MQRFPLIFNPNSRGDKASRAQQFFFQSAPELALHASQSIENARELVLGFAEKGESTVIASGGDGTINQLIDTFLEADLNMGLIPSGTMNVFARELGIPTADLDKAFSVIKEQNIHATDVFRLNDKPFIQMAGIGFDADIIHETNPELKKKLGPLAYLQSAFKVFGQKPPALTIETAEGKSEEGVFILIGNGALYGGQFELFKGAENNDGLMDVLIVQQSGYQAILDFATNYNSDHSTPFHGAEHIHHLRTSGMTVHSDKEVPIELDGEYMGRDTSFTISKDPRQLKALAPTEKIAVDWQETLSAFSSFTPW